MRIQTRALLEISLFAGLTAIGGLIRIPMPLVPITMQTFFVYLSGVFLGGRNGPASQFVFLAIGLLGVPVFGKGGGMMYILQPSFGYLIAFPLASWIVGKMAGDHFDSIKLRRYISGSFFGVLAILLMGTIYLWLDMKFITRAPISWKQSLIGGSFIFLPGEILKLAGVYILSKKLVRIKVRDNQI